jgi:hypothetical protein
VIAHALAPCSHSLATVPSWSYTVPDFYGFRGEKPFYAAFQRSDYSGFRALECLSLAITTQAPAPTHLGFGWLTLVSVLDVRLAQRGALEIRIPGESIVAAVWRDNTNVTFSTNKTAAALPLPQPLQQSASGRACKFECWTAFTVKVATASGKHGLANVHITQSSLLSGYAASVEYFSYVVGDIQRKIEKMHVVVPTWLQVALRGKSMFGDRPGTTRTPLTSLSSARTLSGSDVSQAIGPQWTISMRLVVRR